MAQAKKKTRHSSGDIGKLIGGPSDLPVSDLPTLRDVLAKGIQIQGTQVSGKNDAKLKDLIEDLHEAVVSQYKKVNSNLPLITEKSIKNKLTREWEKYKGFIRNKTSTSSSRFDDYSGKLNKIFDIISCKCPIMTCEKMGCSGCQKKVHLCCSCLDKRIPSIDLEYVHDQRAREGQKGAFQIGGPDKPEMLAMEEKAEKKLQLEEKEENKVEKENRRRTTEKVIKGPDLEKILDEQLGPEEDEQVVREVYEEDPDFQVEKEKVSQNRMSLKNLAKECDRWGVSPRAGAALASAVLVDAGVVTKEDSTKIIDRSKLKRSIASYRETLRVGASIEWELSDDIEGIYFDGKKDETLVFEKDEQGKWRQMRYEEEHYTLGSEPNSEYLTHLSPEGGCACDICTSILDYVKATTLDKSWKVVGSDSTAVITGHKGGVIVLLENGLGRRLYWSICLLHINELPLRHLMTQLDGPTSGSNSFKGPIGKVLPSVEDKGWAKKFQPVNVGPELPEMSDEVMDDLSSDQRYLLLAFNSVRSGVLSPQLKSLAIGPISHARWLTLAARLLVLWMSKHNFKGKTKKNLEILVTFVMTNYCVMWFTIKQKPHIKYGSQHVFRQIQLLRLVKKETRDIVEPYVQRGAYHAHPECIILAMLSDENDSVRNKGVDMVIKL